MQSAQSVDQPPGWSEIIGALDAAWDAVLGNVSRSTAGSRQLTEWYALIVRSSCHDVTRFRSYVYGTTMRDGAMKIWFLNKLRTSLRCSVESTNEFVQELIRLSNIVVTFRKLLRVIFSMEDKKISAPGSLTNGIDAVHVQLKTVFWLNFACEHQSMLMAHACEQLNHFRRGNVINEGEIFGTFQLFASITNKADSENSSDRSLEGALQKVRRELCGTYQKYLVLHCSRLMDEILASNDALPRWNKEAAASAEQERSIIKRSAFFNEAEAGTMMFAALTEIVAKPLPQIVKLPNGGVLSQVVKGEFDVLGTLFANMTMFTQHSIVTDDVAAARANHQLLEAQRSLNADFNTAVADGFRERLQKVSDDFGLVSDEDKKKSDKQFDITMVVANELDLLHRVCREQLQGLGGTATTTEESLKRVLIDGPLKDLPVMMAEALDFAIKSPNITQDERQVIFPKIARLQNLLVEQDKFYENHRARTATRLLTNQQRIDDDRQLLTCLQKFCSVDHSSLNGVVSMMSDIERSATATKELEKALTARNANTDRNVPIEYIPLAQTTWSTFVGSARKTSHGFVNSFLKRTHADMMEWYFSRNPGRKVSLYSEVTLTIRTNAKMSYEFIVPPNMADALMVIATASPTKKELLSYIEFANPGNERLLKEMDKIVEVLSKKIRIVSEGAADAGGKLSINGNFKSPQRKLNLLPREKVDEKVIESNLNFSRAFAVQHALVKVMKKNKDVSVPHNDLMSDAMTLLVNNFKPTAADIKAQIAELISRNVIKRDDKKPGHYLYIA